METVAQTFGHRRTISESATSFLVSPGRVGLEIELERLPDVRFGTNGLWTIVEEDSLRDDGVEFITRGDGIEGQSIIDALDQLEDILNQNPSFSPSWRCSTHVHVDVRQLKLPELKRFILGCVCAEEVLYLAAGGHRKHSNFCMPFIIANELGVILGSAWSSETVNDFWNSIKNRWTKYAGMNLLCIGRLGTIEFRNSEPKYTKANLLRLVNRYLSIQNEAINFEGSDEEWINYLCNEGNLRRILCMGLRNSFRISQEMIDVGKQECMDIVKYQHLALKVSGVPHNFEKFEICEHAIHLAEEYASDNDIELVDGSFTDLEDFLRFNKYYFGIAYSWNASMTGDMKSNMDDWFRSLPQLEKEIIQNY